MNERMKLKKDVIANQFFLTQDRGLKCGRFLYVTTTFSNSLWSVGVSTSMEEFDSWMCTKPIETGTHNILENLSTCEMSLWFCNFVCSSILTESIKWAWRASFEYAHLVRYLPSIQKWCRCFPSVACMCVCARAFSFLVSLFEASDKYISLRFVILCDSCPLCKRCDFLWICDAMILRCSEV